MLTNFTLFLNSLYCISSQIPKWYVVPSGYFWHVIAWYIWDCYITRQTGRVPALSPTVHLTLFIYTKRTFRFLRNTSTLIKPDPNQASISQRWGKEEMPLIFGHFGTFGWGYGVVVSPINCTFVVMEVVRLNELWGPTWDDLGFRPCAY